MKEDILLIMIRIHVEPQGRAEGWLMRDKHSKERVHLVHVRKERD